LNVITALFSDLRQRRAMNAEANAAITTSVPRRNMYSLMQSYYFNNALYDTLSRQLSALNTPMAAIKGLRNPAFRVVEFYPLNVWPGVLPEDSTLKIVTEPTDNKQLIDGIHGVWEESDWSTNKELFVRFMAMYGDGILKIAQDPVTRKSFIQVINALYLTAMEKNYKNQVTKIRMDTPQVDDFIVDDLQITNTVIHTEIWSLPEDSYRLWIHTKGYEASIRDLGKPNVSHSIKGEFGIEFLPFIHCPLFSVGETYGVGSYFLQLDKIDEINQMATRLNHMLYRYNKAFLAISSNSVDKDGRPLPAPNIGTVRGGSSVIEVDGESMITLPGMSKLDSMVPDIDWQGHVNSITAQLDDLKSDLPEMKYYDLSANAAANARAAFFTMSPAIQKLKLARGAAESALIRADRMALYLDGLYNVKGAVKYESPNDPATRHKFELRDYMQLSRIDSEEADLAHVNVMNAKKTVGVDTKTLLKEMGYDDKEIADIEKNKQADLLAMQATFTQANGPMPSSQQMNGKAPNFNEAGNNANDPDDLAPTKQNGQHRVVRGIKD